MQEVCIGTVGRCCSPRRLPACGSRPPRTTKCSVATATSIAGSPFSHNPPHARRACARGLHLRCCLTRRRTWLGRVRRPESFCRSSASRGRRRSGRPAGFREWRAQRTASSARTCRRTSRLTWPSSSCPRGAPRSRTPWLSRLLTRRGCSSTWSRMEIWPSGGGTWSPRQATTTESSETLATDSLTGARFMQFRDCTSSLSTRAHTCRLSPSQVSVPPWR